jgi:Fic family protein
MFPLSESSICGLHRELLQFYPPAEYYLGKYKTVPNNVVEKIIENGKEISQRDVLKTADPGPITESSMRELVTWYNQTLSDYPWTIAVASEFVFRFLAIHPFQDGNGRIGRALFSLSILQSTDKTLKTIIPYLAIDRHIEKRKGEYYQVLQKCSGGKFLQNPEEYKISYFLDFMLRIVKESLKNDIDFYVEKYRAYINLSESQRKVLNCFKEYPEKMLALKDILQFVHVPRRTAIYAINSLMQKLFLQKFGRGPSAKYRLTF